MIKVILLVLFFPLLILADRPTFRIEADRNGVVSEINGSAGDEFTGEYSNQNGAYKLSFGAIIGSSEKKSKWTMDRIPLIYDNEIVGGLTEGEEKSKLYLSALHLFRFKPETLSLESKNRLNDLVPILVKKTASEYFDFVIFIERNNFAEFADAEEFKSFVQNTLSTDVSINDGESWISPHQFGKQEKETTSQFSEGIIRKVVNEKISNKDFTHFYLANSEFNYSSKASSGSIIFAASTARPLGVLQCQINKDLMIGGVLQNTNGLYRILSTDILNKFEIIPLESWDELFQMSQQLIKDPDCDWRDGKLGGGN